MRMLLTPSWALAAVVLAAACGDGGTPAAARGDCPTDPVAAVVTVDQWGDMVERLGGDCVDVRTIIEGSSADPHDYEPTTSDIAAFDDAQLVVMNGLDYDHWAADAVANLTSEPTVVDAGDVVGGSEGDNPHIWYGPDHVESVAAAISDALTGLAPTAADYLSEQRAAWESDLTPYRALVDELRSSAAGRTVAATEPVFDEMTAALGLGDATPSGYRDAALNESEPSPSALAAFEAALEAGEIDVLIDNAQTDGPGPDQLRRVAAGAGVPIVTVTETLPEGIDDFVDWQVDQLRELADALGTS